MARRSTGSASFFILVAAVVASAGCGGGGGSTGTTAGPAALIGLRFPDPSDQSAEPEDDAPSNASLVQQVEFTFDAPPDASAISSVTLPITDAAAFPVQGSYRVEGVVAIFTPTLPLRPVVALPNGAFDDGGAGLDAGRIYVVQVSPRIASFVTRVAPDLLARFGDPNDPLGIRAAFVTTSDPTKYFGGVADRPPVLLATNPVDGATGVSPNLHVDPGGLFPPSQSFTFEFDGPLHPATTAISDALFRLIDLDDRGGSHPEGLPLGADVRLLVNQLDHAVVELAPAGVLPFGHLLALECPMDPAGLGGAGVASGTAVAAAFTTADPGAAPVADLLEEDFDTTARQDPDLSTFGVGQIGADWDDDDSNVLQAGLGFVGDGLLGRFIPPPPPAGEERRLVLDTSAQVMPLFDGSTPDAPPGYVVKSGIFAFTDIDIPEGVVIEVLGPNPLVLSATGSVRLAGRIVASGSNGSDDNAFDSGVASVPGGAGVAGGGRGGESHPILFFPPGQVSLLSMVSPPEGGDGYTFQNLTRNGGRGGESGILDERDGNGNYATDQEISCQEAGGGANSNGDYGAGAGGGSLFTAGTEGRAGVGNVRPDGVGGWDLTTDANPGWNKLEPGAPGDHPFATDGSKKNDYIGPGGQVATLTAGQGGGGGGSRSEAYYCGSSCLLDADPGNDALCKGGEFNGAYADSVGDARGGGGGGGGGAILIQALGDIEVLGTCSITAVGGHGGGGEALGGSNWGGPGAGGSGGAILIQAGGLLIVRAGARVDVSNGVSGLGGGVGRGGAGIVQLQVPAGSMAVVEDSLSIVPTSSWADPNNTQNPAPFNPLTVALSRWYDLGRMVARTPGVSPSFTFAGLNPSGYVDTDAEGNVLDPPAADVVCDYLGQLDPLTRQYEDGEEPREDYIPPSAKIRVEFQGAHALAEGSKEVDPATLTAWTVAPSIANAHQFIRWRVTFDIAARPGDVFGPESRRPVLQRLQIHARY